MVQNINYTDVSGKCAQMREISNNIKNISSILIYNYPSNKNEGEFATEFNSVTSSIEESIGYMNTFISKYAELLEKVASCYASLDTQLSEMTNPEI